MDELVALSPCGGLLPVSRGDLILEECAQDRLTALLPFKTMTTALAEPGVVLPAAGAQLRDEAGVLRWFGKDSYLAIGRDLPEAVAAMAALSDQSDAWARMRLSGPQVEAVMARLTPVDLRAQVFGVDRTCRSLLGHMNASITRVAEDAFEIMVFRSMAQTAVHEITETMAQVTARSSN